MMKKKIKKKKKKLSQEELAFKKIQNEHKKLVRSIFVGSGFDRIPEIANKTFTFEGQMGDLDDYFVFENLIVAVEYTAKSENIGEHIKPKKILFDKILKNPIGFLEFISKTFPGAAKKINTGYHESQTVFKLVYCSRYQVEEKYKENVPGPIYFDYPPLYLTEEIYVPPLILEHLALRYKIGVYTGRSPEEAGLAFAQLQLVLLCHR